MAAYKEDKDSSQYQHPIKGKPICNDNEADGQHLNDATNSVEVEPSQEDQFDPKTTKMSIKKKNKHKYHE
jgi:hypothetical protein